MRTLITRHAVVREECVQLTDVQIGIHTSIMLTISCVKMKIAGKNKTITIHVAQCKETVRPCNAQTVTFTGTTISLYFARASIAIQESIRMFVVCRLPHATPTIVRMDLGTHQIIWPRAVTTILVPERTQTSVVQRMVIAVRFSALIAMLASQMLKRLSAMIRTVVQVLRTSRDAAQRRANAAPSLVPAGLYKSLWLMTPLVQAGCARMSTRTSAVSRGLLA
jgi:hypothetical protein